MDIGGGGRRRSSDVVGTAPPSKTKVASLDVPFSGRVCSVPCPRVARVVPRGCGSYSQIKIKYMFFS